MSGYVDHAWRHAPKAAGGTDPIPAAAAGTDLPYMVAALGDWAGGSPWNAYLPMDTGSNRSRTSDAAMFAVQSDGIVVQSDGLFAVTANVRTTGGNPAVLYAAAWMEESDGTFVDATQSVWGLTQQSDDAISASYANARYIGLFSMRFTGAATQVRFFVGVEDYPHSGTSVAGKSLSVVKLSADGTGLLTSLDLDI